jgi:LysR family hydrogen peroxide-inducible transcriptional activator
MTVHDGATSTLLPRVASSEIDAAIVHIPGDADDFDIKPLFAEDLLLLVHSRHHLAQRDSVTITELAAHPVLLAPTGSALRRTVDRAAASRGVRLRPQAEIDGVRLLASLAFEGFGPAIVPASAVPGWLRGEFVRVAVPELPRRRVGWVQRRRPRPNLATLAVAQVVRDMISRHGARTPGVHPES